MVGAGTQWSYLTTTDREGTSRYAVVALNADGKAGSKREMQLTVDIRPVEAISVTNLEVKPDKGYSGEKFTFKATTDRPTQQVNLIISGKRYKMKGSGKEWVLKRKIEKRGTIAFSAAAVNEDGKLGGSKSGFFMVEAHPVKVVTVLVPKAIYTGQDYVIEAVTDRPAQTVVFEMDDLAYDMVGSGKRWKFQKREMSTGKKKFTIIARNVENKLGPPKHGTLTIQPPALPIPAVASILVNPKKVFVGERFSIRVKTDKPAHTVDVEINGRKEAMEGAGTNWRYSTKIDKVGKISFKVSAMNKAGRKGKSIAKSVAIEPKPVKLVAVTALELKPKKVVTGEKFTFKATTDSPAKHVSLVLGDNRYEMSGSGTTWTLTKKVDKPGDIKVSAMAFNADEVEGAIQTTVLIVEEKIISRFKCNKNGTVTDNQTGEIMRRFVDNRDGTVTDRCTDLMWLKEPKRIAVSWQEARSYCKQVKVKKYAGWRLPTIKELNTLIDKRQQNPALPPRHPFSNVYTHKPYWTKTDSRPPLYVYQMELRRGRRQSASKRRNASVWPVRYAR